MIVSINQPAYLPWLGYFHRIVESDVHIVLDHVQFEKNSFTNRNKIRTVNGWTWLTVPLKTSGRFGDLAINRLQIDGSSGWSRKHWETIRQNYRKAPYFSRHEDFFVATLASEWKSLADLCKHMTSYLLWNLQIPTEIRYSSHMNASGTKDDLVLNLCRQVGATTYISGALGRNYLREEPFRAAGIKVVYQEYRHPVYPQLHGAFEPCMAAIDLVFNCGPTSLDILMKDQLSISV